MLILVAVLAPALAWAAPYADYVIDARTGEVLHQDNADARLHPASLTKMMTLYIAFEAIEHGEISLDTMVTVSRHAASQPPSRLGLKAGQRIALRYLIRAAAIKSANDAATAIGEAIEGSESAFARRMTRTARALGMTRTTFKNANGLTTPGHLSTAHDMTILGRHLFYDYPQYYNLFSRTTADAGIARVASTNRHFLSSYRGADGIKTGYTSAAGFNLTASAERGGKRIIATVFGGRSTATRNARVAELLDLGFRRAPQRVAEQRPRKPAYVPGHGAADDVAVVLAEAVAGTRALPAGKTIRLNVAVKTSPRPRPRPVPGEDAAPAEPLLVALQEGISAAVAEAQAEEMAEAQAVEVAEDVAAAAADVLAPAAEAAEAEAGDPPAASLAEAPATAAPGTEPQAEATVTAAAAGLNAPAASPRPRAAPRPAPDAAVSLAAAPAPRSIPDKPAAPAMPAPAAAAGEVGPRPAAAAAEPIVVASAAAPAAPAALGDVIILDTLDAPMPATEPADLEIVTRVSTSGGRQWAINVGHFTTRYNAERQLLQTALIEMNTLDEALRKVVPRRGGYDANFVGLTEEMAELACRRLQARQAECRVLSP